MYVSEIQLESVALRKFYLGFMEWLKYTLL